MRKKNVCSLDPEAEAFKASFPLIHECGCECDGIGIFSIPTVFGFQIVVLLYPIALTFVCSFCLIVTL